ncbi:MAG: O-antigen ligase family protein [Chloroflexi bacterium]|nr:O-antigen ligase family protein [Chloroflexota bacterium]
MKSSLLRRWIIFLTCCLVLLVSIGAILNRRSAEARATRGWELATEVQDMPYRQPIGGVNVELTQYALEELDTQLQAIDSLGFTWLRQTVYWSRVEPEQGTLDWSVYDPIVEAVAKYPHLKLVLVLDSAPRWARHHDAPDNAYAPPASVEAFANFARAVAERYGATVDHYQVWDEPNIRDHWGSLDPRPALYVAMLKAAYTAIHEADGQATVMAAALAPNVEDGPENLSDVLYLRAIYDLGGKDSFDAAAGKPYGYSASPDDRTTDAGTLNFSRLILLREEMVAHGDGAKPLWGSNFGWNALPADWSGPPSIWGQVSAANQIAYTQVAYQRAENEWAWVGGLILQHWQPDAPADDPIQGFAIAPHLVEWQAAGLPFKHDALLPGLYPAVNPFTVYEGDWQFSDLGADAGTVDPNDPNVYDIKNSIRVTFRGTDFAMLVRRDDYVAYLAITIDGHTANDLPTNKQGESFLILTSPARQPTTDLIPVASGLDDGLHVAEIIHRPWQGDDRWAIAGFAIASAPDTLPYQRVQVIAAIFGLLAVIGIAGSAYRLPFRQVKMPSREALQNIADVAITLLVSFIFVIGVVLSWGDMVTTFLRRDTPALIVSLTSMSVAYYSPIVWGTLAALAVFGVIVFNRPLMGLLAVLFWSAYFTANLDAYVQLIAVVEVMLAISAAAIIGRGLYEWAKIRRSTSPRKTTFAPHVTLLNLWNRLSTLDIVLMMFFGLAVISLSWADLRSEALRELRTMIIDPLAFYVLLRLARLKEKDLALLAEGLILTGTMVALVGLYNYITETYVVFTPEGAKRLVGIYGSPNSVALELGRCLPFAFAYLILPVGWWRRVYAGVGGAIMLLAVLLTQSMGAIAFGLPAAFVVIILGWQGRRAWLPLGGLAIAGGVALIPLSLVVPRLRHIFDFDNIRINVWRSAIELIKDHPITGVGLDQFLYAYRGRYILSEAWADPDLSHPHNVVLDYWVRLGIFGVLIGVWLQVAFWRTAVSAYQQVRKSNPLLLAIVLGAMGSMADFLAHGMIDSAYFAINLSFIFMLLLVLVQEIGNTAKNLEQSESRHHPDVG